MVENSPKLMKHANLHIKEAQYTLNRINVKNKRCTQTHHTKNAENQTLR